VLYLVISLGLFLLSRAVRIVKEFLISINILCEDIMDKRMHCLLHSLCVTEEEEEILYCHNSSKHNN